MAFLSSFDICASGMSAQRVRMDIAAENIANIDTTRTESGGSYRKKKWCWKAMEQTPFSRRCVMPPKEKALPAGMQGSGWPMWWRTTGR